MPQSDPVLSEMFIASFNADLARLNSAARIALPPANSTGQVFELHDEEDNFLCFMPIETPPAAIAETYALYARALDMGLRTGERIAWSRLRSLIGAAPAS